MSRLLRIEARRSALLPLLPLLAVLLCLTPIARHLQPTALWPDRSTDLQGSIQLIGPFTAAAAAWMASRERRRDMTGLLASTPRSPWRRWTATWAATCGLAVLFYAALVAVIFSVTAAQATWGHPVAWPVLSGLASLVTCSALGFAAGRLAPSRFTPPLAGIGTFLVMTAGLALAIHGGAAGRLSPIYPSIGLSASVFYAIRPDLAYVQVICYAGVTATAFGAVAAAGHAGYRAARRGGTLLAACGLVLITAAGWLVSTSRSDAQGIVIPLLHDAASDNPVPYTPVCARAGTLPVCLHPAYASANELAALAITVTSIAAPLAGTPGLPVRAEQFPGQVSGLASVVEGSPPVLRLPLFIIHGNSIEPPAFAAAFRTWIALALVTTAGTARPVAKAAAGTATENAPTQATQATQATKAQQAAALYLLRQAGYAASLSLIPADPAITAAAQRLAALTAPARRAWLTARITALRAGTVTLTEIP